MQCSSEVKIIFIPWLPIFLSANLSNILTISLHIKFRVDETTGTIKAETPFHKLLVEVLQYKKSPHLQ